MHENASRNQKIVK